MKDKVSSPRETFITSISETLSEIQNNLLRKAKVFRDSHTQMIENKDDFEAYFADADAGFASVGFCLDPQLEDELAKRLKISVRCIPNDSLDERPTCIFTGKEGKRVLFARSY